LLNSLVGFQLPGLVGNEQGIFGRFFQAINEVRDPAALGDQLVVEKQLFGAADLDDARCRDSRGLDAVGGDQRRGGRVDQKELTSIHDGSRF
jgi:hypothetical protein